MQTVILLTAAVVTVVVAGFLWAMWWRGRALHAGSETLRQYWRGLEKALVDHHQAAEDLVRRADATGALRRREREQVEAAVAAATLTGTPHERARREAVLHGAASELLELLEGRPAADTSEVAAAAQAYSASWDQVCTLGERYCVLVADYNRLVSRPLARVWNRRLGWQAAEDFQPQASEPAGELRGGL